MKYLAHRIAAAAVTLVPAAALAQTGSVTTSPLTQPAPAMSTVMLVLLSVTLAAVAFRLLRRAPQGSLAAFALAAVTAVGAAVGYATPTDVVVEGSECTEQYTHEYNANYGPRNLVSACPSPIRIVALGEPCNTESLDGVQGEAIPASPCEVGQILQNGDRCHLPDCD
jgi:hypothetical protein